MNPFLSTSPLRGTTQLVYAPNDIPVDFYPRPPCGGRLQLLPYRQAALRISIHVPLAGDDTMHYSNMRAQDEFLSTSPLRGTTEVGILGTGVVDDFYPRPPCGGRRNVCALCQLTYAFLSTSPLRGTTQRSQKTHPCLTLFLSTSPLRGTTNCVLFQKIPFSISIHVPLAGDDPRQAAFGIDVAISIHVPLAGDDDASTSTARFLCNFYPRPPCGGRLSIMETQIRA